MRTRPLLITAAVAAATALMLSGCSSSAPEEPASAGTAPQAGDIALPAKIADKGAIDVGVYFNYPPFTFEEGGELQGIEADLARAVGEQLGVEVRFHDLAFEAMVPSVINGRTDMLIGPMADTTERRKEVSFIDTLSTKMQALVKKGNPTGFDIADPCGAKGGEVAASNNLTTAQAIADTCAAEGEPEISLLKLQDAGGVFQAVISGRTDFTLQEPALAKYMVETTPDLELQGDPIPSSDGEWQGWVFAKDDTETIDAVYAAIEALIEDGTWQGIMEEAGLEASMALPPRVNGEERNG
ncbi:transporter substrate-binding domain-containing protein [Leucobacter sp.]